MGLSAGVELRGVDRRGGRSVRGDVGDLWHDRRLGGTNADAPSLEALVHDTIHDAIY